MACGRQVRSRTAFEDFLTRGLDHIRDRRRDEAAF
jgi:hypothetical protein